MWKRYRQALPPLLGDPSRAVEQAALAYRPLPNSERTALLAARAQRSMFLRGSLRQDREALPARAPPSRDPLQSFLPSLQQDRVALPAQAPPSRDPSKF